MLVPTSARGLLPLTTTEPIHILGAGAMGMLIAASIRCAFPSYPVKLLLRDTDENRAVKSRSICLRRGFEDDLPLALDGIKPSLPSMNLQPSRRPPRPRMIHVPCETATSRRQDERPDIRNLIVTTKAGSAVEALNSVRHRLFPINFLDDETPSTRILLLCNGALAVTEEWNRQHQDEYKRKLEEWKTLQQTSTAMLSSLSQTAVAAEVLANLVPSPPQYRPPHRLYLGLTTHGVYAEPKDENDVDDLHNIVHAGNGSILLQGSSDIAALLDACGLKCSFLLAEQDEAMQLLLWKKLAANCIVNPLTALHGCLNGEIVNLPRFADFYHGVLLEIAQVYTILSYIKTLQGKGGKLDETKLPTQQEHQATVGKLYDDLRQSVDAVIRDTAQNKSSMLQDVTSGRRTEVEHLSGYVVRMGNAVGVATPVNEQLWTAVQALEPPVTR